MNELNLADLYQSANISLSAEDFAARQAAFATLGTALGQSQIIDLVRLYFSFGNTGSGFEWFRSGFASTDPRFSLVANKREASVLAGGLLFTSLANGNAFAGIAVLAASIGGKRAASVTGIGIPNFARLLDSLAVRQQRAHAYSTTLKPLGKTSVTKEALSASPSIAVLGDYVFLANEELHTSTKSYVNELHSVVNKMGEDLAESREEIEMLWWLMGGWSRSLKRSFSELGIPLSAVSAGFDLADLSSTVHGPYAAEAMLTRVLGGTKKPKKISASLAEVGDSVAQDICAQLGVSASMDKYADICPLSNSLRKSAEIGKGLAWHQSFQKTSYVNVTLQMSPVEIAMQAMRERLLLSNL